MTTTVSWLRGIWLAGAALITMYIWSSESRADGLELTFICEPGECSDAVSRDIQRYFYCKRVGFKEPKEFAKWRISRDPALNLVIGYGETIARQEPADLLFYPGATQRTLHADGAASCRRMDRFDKGSSPVVFALFQWDEYGGLTDADKACLDEVRSSFSIPKGDMYCSRVDVSAPASTLAP